ncbi:hypothetical protein [Acetobacter sp.]
MSGSFFNKNGLVGVLVSTGLPPTGHLKSAVWSCNVVATPAGRKKMAQ